MLEAAPSNIPDLRNDVRTVYERFVVPARADLTGVGAHYAVSAMFDDLTGGKRSIVTRSAKKCMISNRTD